jgi:hypothetical protein
VPVTAPPSSERHATAGVRDSQRGHLGDSPTVRRLLPTALAVVALAGCHGPSRTQTHFCERLRTSAPVLTAPIGSAAAGDAVVQEFVALAKVTPLAIEDDWNALTDLVRTAATMDLADPTARDDLATKIFASDAAAKNVLTYSKDRCGVDLSGAIPDATTPTTVATPPTSGG